MRYTGDYIDGEVVSRTPRPVKTSSSTALMVHPTVGQRPNTLPTSKLLHRGKLAAGLAVMGTAGYVGYKYFSKRKTAH